MARLSLQEIHGRLEELDGWDLNNEEITKTFNFETFAQAMVFVNEIANIAEEEQHHPLIVINNNVVVITLTTVAEKGLTAKDFILAKEINSVK